MLVAAARRNNKICQMGNQRRSWSKIKEAIGLLKGGGIGPASLCPLLVRERAQADRRRQAGPGPGVAELGPLAGTGPARRLPGQRGPLQLALVLALGHGRGGKQRRPPARPGPLGDRRRLPDAGDLGGRALLRRRRLAAARHPDDLVRVPEPGPGDLGRDELQRGRGLRRGVRRAVPGREGAPCACIPGNGYTLYDDKGKEVRTETEAEEPRDITIVGPGLGYDIVHVQNFLESIRGRQTARLRDRGRPQEHDARPPGEYRPADGPRAQVRSQDGPDPRRRRRDAVLETRIRAGLGAEGDGE